MIVQHPACILYKVVKHETRWSCETAVQIVFLQFNACLRAGVPILLTTGAPLPRPNHVHGMVQPTQGRRLLAYVRHATFRLLPTGSLTHREEQNQRHGSRFGVSFPMKPPGEAQARYTTPEEPTSEAPP